MIIFTINSHTQTTNMDTTMKSNEHMAYANGWVKGMLLDMQRDATSGRERKAVGHIIHVSSILF